MAATKLVCSQDAQAYKPRQELFLKALEVMEVQPKEVLFVGDSLKYDIEPALKAGMYAAWINRSNRMVSPQVKPDLICPDLLALRAQIR